MKRLFSINKCFFHVCALLINFYSCRALTKVPKLYSDIILKKNKELNDLKECIEKYSLSIDEIGISDSMSLDDIANGYLR